jgi:hypothetical protein
MKPTHLVKGLFICFIFYIWTPYCNAQTTKIAIVSVADTTVLHRHAGLTVFSNFSDTLHLNFSIIRQLENKLQTYLTSAYSVAVVQLPDSVLKVKDGFFSSARNKKIKQWIKNSKDQYNVVIVIDNKELPDILRFIPNNSSGLLSRPGILSYYTTITFNAYRTSNLNLLEYYEQGGEFLKSVKNFKLPEDKRSFTPEMLNLINEGFKSYLDSRVEHFLTKSYLVPQSKIEEIKGESGTAK